jgi:uncharacterized surface protein with fasciclin (FAS1) repeats
MNVKKLLIAATVTAAAFGAQAKDIVDIAMAAGNGVIHAIDTVLMPK